MGGAGGHMRHPHDLEEVKNGQDIIALFRAIPAYLRSEEFKSGQTTSLKLDGSNNAIKVVEDADGGFQFAVDRGGKGTSSMTQIDVQGVTIDRLQDRFPQNPGLANSSAGLISMMARAYSENKDQMFGLLQSLGLIDENGTPDPTKFINVEYIDRLPEDIDDETGMGRANAIYYSFDSITFLNISQFYEVVTKVTRKDPETGKSLRAPNGRVLRDIKQTRPGLERPMAITIDNNGNKVEKPTGDTSTSIDFDRSALDELARLVAPYAPKSKSKQQFNVLGPGDLGIDIDHDAKEGEDIGMATERAIDQLQQNIETTLNSELTFRISDQTAVTKKLKEWLAMAINFLYKPDITLIDGSKKNPFHGALHNQLVDLQTPLAELVPLGDDLQCAFDGSLTDCEKAIYGAIFNEAARRLGNTVKQSLQAKVDKFGSAVDNEGVVINAGMPFGDKVTGNTFKLTGEFFVDKDQGVYAVREEVKNDTVGVGAAGVPPEQHDALQHLWNRYNKKIENSDMLYIFFLDAEKNNLSGQVENIMPSLPYNFMNQLESQLDIKYPIIEISKVMDYYFKARQGILNYRKRTGAQGGNIDIEREGILGGLDISEQTKPQVYFEDENQDPVTDKDYTGRTIALIPGSMKPPTVGHVGMIERYSKIVSSNDPDGRVYVFVSNPVAVHKKGKKKGQPISIRGFAGRTQGISQKEASELLKKMLPKEILAPAGNVEIIPSPHASPISPVYDFISPNDISNIKQAAPGDTVILGSSTKGGDADRWNDIINNQSVRVRPGVQVRNMPVDPITHTSTEDGISYLDYLRSSEGYEMLNSLPTVVKARKKNPNLDVENIDLTNISASDARYLMGFMHDQAPQFKQNIAKNLIKAFFGKNTKEVLQYLGYEPKDVEDLEEMSSVGGGAISHGVQPAIKPVRRKLKKTKKKKKQKENIDTTLIDDVMRLIMERGIMQ